MLTLEQAKTHLDQTRQLIEQGKYTEAMELLEQAAPIFEIAEKWEEYVQCLNKQSECFRHSGKYSGGIEKAEKALQICLERWGENNANTARSYNDLGTYCNIKENYNQAITYFKRSLATNLVIFGEQHPDVASCYHRLGVSYIQQSNHIQAVANFQQALTIRLVIFGEQHPQIVSSYISLVRCYIFIGDHAQALAHNKKALNICLATVGKQHPSTALVYNGLGLCAFEIGDYTQAITYHQQSLAIRLVKFGEQHPDIASSYSNLGNCYMSKDNFFLAIDCYQKALAIQLAILDEQSQLLAHIYDNLGVCYTKRGDYTQSMIYFQQALAIRLAIHGEQHEDVVTSYNNLHILYKHLGDYYKSIAYNEQALNICLAIVGKQHPRVAQAYCSYAQSYNIQFQYHQALKCLQNALQSLALDVPDEDYYPLPKLAGYNSVLELLEILPTKAAIFTALYHQSQTPQDLTAALAHYQCADELIEQMRQVYKTEGSKLLLAEKGKDTVYDVGLEALFTYQSAVKDEHNNMLTLSHFNQTLGYQLPDRPIDLAFHFSEKSKAVLLFAGMKDAEARLNAQLPPDLVQQEYDLRVELTYLERRISEEGYKKDEEQDKTALNEWQSQHFEFKNQYDALIERLETDYPKYYQLKYDLQAATIAQVQAALPPQKAMISYVLAAKHLYIIIITAQNSTWLQTDLPTDFEGLVEDFLFSFQSIGKRNYLTYSYDLYRHLMLPAVNTGMLQGIQQLIIIPDGMLSRVPFEALLTHACSDDTVYKDFPYLLHQYRIAYHYSATLWLNQQTESPPPAPPTGGELSWEETLPPTGGVGGGLDFIGFAPVYSTTAQNSTEHDIDLTLPDDFYEKIGIEKPEEKHRIEYAETDEVRSVVEGRNFVELVHSETEVRNVAELFAAKQQTAKILLHTKATLDNFKALSGKYRYILIAAHADYNDKKPDQTGIIFSPNETDGNGIFYMGDAYNLQLQADLVVLSCCETGLGKVSKGEGTMALNRGFLYSGAKNVVYTLFKVYDKQSCELTTELFKQLIAQQPSIEALHQAKLNLIARGLMPNKWAGYVLVGQ